MEYRKLGRSGLLVSELSFGSWVTFGNQIGDNIAEDCMKLAYDNGVNFFDNAEVYAHGQSEIVMGQILRKMGWARDTFVVSSKVFWGGQLPNQMGLSRKHVVEGCNAALKRLQVEYLDLFFCHRPDKTTPVEETVWTMHNLIQQGKILYWGTSEWSAQEIMEAHMVARQYNLIPPVMEQCQYSMLWRDKMENDFLKIFTDIGMGTTIWSPLASGLLTGKYNNGVPEGSRMTQDDLSWLRERMLTEANIEKVRNLGKLADELGISMPTMAIAWCLKNQNVSSVILGASKLSQLEETLKSADAVALLTEDVMGKIEEILGNKPVLPQW